MSVVAHGARYAHIRSFHGGPRITVYSGLLEHWTPLERRGALGHELGHIVNGDWLSYRRVFVPAAALTGAGYVVIFALHWLIGVTFIWMGLYTLLPISLWVGFAAPLSRRSELDADRAGTRITGPGPQMAALAAIERESAARRAGNPAVSRLLRRFDNPAVSRLLRRLDNYPTLTERRAAVLEASSQPVSGCDHESPESKAEW